MSHFYGTIQGKAGEATRCGSKKSGLHTETAGWGGCIDVQVYYSEKHERDMFTVKLKPWGNGGDGRIIAEGFLDSEVTDPFIPALIA